MKNSLWKFRPFLLSAVGWVAAGALADPAAAQTEQPRLDGRPGVDATPDDLRAPVQGAPERTPAPIPPATAGAARPVPIDPEREARLQEEGTPGAATAAAGQGQQSAQGSPTVFSIIAGSEEFTTLAGAIRAADMEATLSEAGASYTLFAPNNRAFEALPEGVLKVLLQPANQETLRNLVSYHVVQGRLTSEDLKPRAFATLTGDQLTVAGAAEGKITVQGANLTRANVQGGNGVIHVIDQVLLPPNFNVDDIQPPAGAAVVIDEVTGEVEKVEIPPDAVLPE
jgi:uncharacterized surface protein with fasciclin (FAS1) repeats